jgi:serine/threonine protein kinase
MPRMDRNLADPDPTGPTEDRTTVRDPDPQHELIGKVISDRYRIEALLGKGAMGDVFRGEQILLRKRVAIKVLRSDAERLPEMVERFEREGIAGAHINHPNVTAAIDFGRLEDGSYFLVLEYVEGVALSKELGHGPMPLHRALRVARQVAAGLVAIHAKGIVHRDIKPENLLLTADESVKIIDFGLAKVALEKLSSEARAVTLARGALTAEGMVLGTVAYMPPEVALGMEAVDARGDLYALGIVLYELLAGLRPFDPSSVVTHFKRLRTQAPPRIRERAPKVQVPRDVEAIIMRLIQRNPADRYANAEHALQAIEDALERLSSNTSAGRETDLPTRVLPPPPSTFRDVVARTRKVPRPIAAGVGVALVVGFGVILFRGASDGSSETREARAAQGRSGRVDVAPPEPSSEPWVEDSSGPPGRPAIVDDADATQWRSRLKKASKEKDWPGGADALLALGEIDPTLVGDLSLRLAIVAVVTGIASEPEANDKIDKVFDLLQNGSDLGGLEVLYDTMVLREGTPAATRARSALGTPNVRSRMTPTLKIALELRDAACDERPALVERAGKEADHRALLYLHAWRNEKCPSSESCCSPDEATLANAIRSVKARAKSQ